MRIHARPITRAVFPLAVLLMGLAAIPAPAGALPDFAFQRLAGSDRFDTARVISGELGRSDTVILARGDVFADALAGTYLAGVNQAPVLLTRSDGLPPQTDAAIDAAGARRVLLLGGTSAISPAVENHLRSKGLAVERIGGTDRYETAGLAARHGGPSVLGTSDGLRTAIVVSGANFPDALSGGPVSYAQKFPTLLTAPGAASPSMLAAIDALEIRQVIIIGGPTAVSASVESTLRSRGLNVNRLFGQDRSGTSVAVARIAVERFGHSPAHANVARGDDFADALAFTAHAGRDPRAGKPAPLFLTISRTVAGQELVEAFRSQAGLLADGDIAGGLSALSQEVEDELARAARGGSSDLELDWATVAPGGTMRGEVRGDSIGTISVSGCGLRGLDIRQGAGAFQFEIPSTQTPGTCSLVFTTNFTDGRPSETDRRTITVEQAAPGNNAPPTTQPNNGGTTPTTQPAPTTTSPTTTPPSNNGTTPTTQPSPSTTSPTTQPAPTTTPTTATKAPVAPAVSGVADDTGGGNVDGSDIHEFAFPTAISSAADDDGSSYVIRDSAGLGAEVTCGAAATCFFLPPGTYGQRTVSANSVLRVRLLSTPRKLQADESPVRYPVTLASADWRSSDGSSLAVSGTRLEIGGLNPQRQVGSPTPQSAREVSHDEIVLAFGKPIAIACGTGADLVRQVAFKSHRGTYNPGAIEAGSTVRLLFAANSVLQDGMSDGDVLYGDSTGGIADCGDLVDTSGNAVGNFGPLATSEP